MAQKNGDNQKNIIYLRSSCERIISNNPIPFKLNKTKALAKTLAQSLNIQDNEKQLVFLLGYDECDNNVEVIIHWLTKQQINVIDSSIRFHDLQQAFSTLLENAVNNFSSI